MCRCSESSEEETVIGMYGRETTLLLCIQQDWCTWTVQTRMPGRSALSGPTFRKIPANSILLCLDDAGGPPCGSIPSSKSYFIWKSNTTSQPGVQEKGEWMARPQSVTAGIPTGLEYLAELDQLLIHQQVELFEALTDIETKNRYAIKNVLGQQVYFAHEESGFCMRICCQNQRGFLMHIVDNFGQEVIRLERRFKCCAGCCWFAGTDCCAWEVDVEAPPGRVIGRVRQGMSWWKPYFHIIDDNDTTVLNILGPCCACQEICCTCDIDFNVLALDGHTEVGKVSKHWAGIVKEWLTQADNFGVSFPKDMNVKVKALLLAASFLIDYMFFERNNN